MIAPQARGLEVPDAAGIPALMEQIQRNLHLFGRYGITMFAISGLDIALWDLAAKRAGRAAAPPARRAASARTFRPMRACCGSARPTASPANARRRSRSAMAPSSCTRPRRRRCFPRGRRSARHSADGRHELPAGRRAGDRICAGMPGRAADVPGRAGLAAGGFCDARRGPQQGRARHRRRRERLHGISIPPDDGCRRGQPRPAVGDQGRRHHGISEGRARSQISSASRSFRTPRISARACWRHCICWRCATTGWSKCSI